MAKDVVVKISAKSVIGTVSFGIPLILAGGDEKEIAYTECSSLSEVVEVGFDDTTDIYKASKLLFMQDDNPAKIAVCSSSSKVTDILNDIIDNDFRQVIVVNKGENTLKEIAEFIETTQDKIYFTSVKTISELDVLNELDRTIAFVYGGETKFIESALVGATAGLKVGSFTYKNMILKGVVPEKLKDGEIKNIHNAGGIAFITKAGDNVTTEGKSISGEYLDVIDSNDYIIQNIEYRGQKLLNNSPKVPYTNVGIAQLENITNDVLTDAFNNGMIATDEDGLPAFSTDFAKREECSEVDRANRIYNGGKFTYQLAGAVHEAEINGTLII